MENSNKEWIYKYHMNPSLVASFYTEQEYVDHMFIWLIYANFGILLSTEELLDYAGRDLT